MMEPTFSKSIDEICEHPEDAVLEKQRPCFGWRFLMTVGPGLMVCFADTDGSCLLTAADSGSRWGYKLVFLQILLVPILYLAQELTVRLALVKGKGIAGLVRQEVGPMWGWAVAVPLLLDASLALLSEINMIGQTMLVCWNVPVYISSTISVLFLLILALTGSYSAAEKVGLAMGSLQLLFFITMFMNFPSGKQIWTEMWSMPFGEPSYVKLVTANIGAVIMPWMLAYQQSALCHKGIPAENDDDNFFIERLDTGLGSVLTQGVMLAMLITVASSSKFKGDDIDNVGQVLEVFTATTGSLLKAKLLLTFGIGGACIVASIVVTMCGAWALEEAFGTESTEETNLEDESEGSCDSTQTITTTEIQPRPCFGHLCFRAFSRTACARPAFFVSYATACSLAWCLNVIAPTFANDLAGVWTQFINGLLMPPILFSLWYLSAYKLPQEHRLGTLRKWFLCVLFAAVSGFCLVSVPFALKDAFEG